MPFAKSKRYKAVRSKIIRPMPLGLLLALATTLILGFGLFSLVAFTPSEHPVNQAAASGNTIKDHALFAPVKTLQLGILKLTDQDAYIRLAPAATAFVSALLLYFMLRKWFSARVSLLTSLLFICSSWFLHHGRLVNSDVMYLGVIPALLLSSMWLLSKRYQTRLPLAALLIGLTLYVPGSWLFLLAGAIYFRRYIWRVTKKIPLKIMLPSVFIFLATIAPLIYSFSLKQRQIIEWLGFNENQTLSWSQVGSNFADIPRQLFISGIDEPLLWLGGTPVLDIFMIAMLGLGFYAYRAGRYPAREKLVLGALIISVILIGAGNIVSLSLIIPLLFIVIANGLAYMLQSWFTVFPQNPFARTLGVLLLTAAVGLSCFYQAQRYFIAWPQAQSTQSALNQKD